MKAIATSLNLHLAEFVRQYTVEQENDEGQLLTTLKNKAGVGCALLGSDKKTCIVYEARPIQCRTYPFWSQNMIGEAEWRAEASRCEGIDINNETSAVITALPTAPVVAPETIVRQMIVSQIHQRGVGPNWTYDEAIELLDRTPERSTAIDSFINEFSAKNFSKLVFENASLRVVDVTTVDTVRIDDYDDDDDDDEQQELIGMEVDSHETTSTIRHLEFVRSSQLAQTEMLVLPSPNDGVDHGQLIMPIHRLLATVGLNVGSPNTTHIAILGAGGCALPSYLAHTRKDMRLSAVEPDREVLTAASQLFGAKLRYDHWQSATENSITADNGDIAAFVTDGASFLQEASGKGVAFDAMLIDAFEMACDSDSDDAAAESRAPPRSLLDAPLLLSCLRAKGVLAVNMYGPPAWFDEVSQALCPPVPVSVQAGNETTESGCRRFGRPIVLEFRNDTASPAARSADTTGSLLGANDASRPRNAMLIAAAEEDTDDLFRVAMGLFKVSQGGDGGVATEGSTGTIHDNGHVDGWVTTLTHADIASLTIRD